MSTNGWYSEITMFMPFGSIQVTYAATIARTFVMLSLLIQELGPRCVAAQIVVILQRINYRSLAETSRHHARPGQQHKHTDNALKSTVGNNLWCSLKFTFAH